MSINERPGPQKSRWPMSFDIEAIPRDSATRTQLLEQERANMADNNKFAGEIDLNNPPKDPNYVPLPFPKMIYHADGRFTIVKDDQELSVAKRKGFETKPHPDYDYSRYKNGRAEKKEAVVPEETFVEEPAPSEEVTAEVPVAEESAAEPSTTDIAETRDSGSRRSRR